ncbi:hypothetical protein AB0M54_33495 [Actinoplanes sp. NPDC051470]|uniref:hypothetical protein n=1 Tax=Actinoplanes sp. NPDC051470 TaxID=3157224 RepID=UPI00343A0BC6
MWPWRRKRDEPAPAPAPAPVVSPRPPADQWRLVAPIQRVVGNDILANPVQRFSGSLASWQDPRFVGSLGHGVGAGEPSGTIGEFARPATAVPDYPAGSLPAMPVATPQPAPETGRSLGGTAHFTVARLAEPASRPAGPVFQPAEPAVVSRLAEPQTADEPSPVEAAPQPGMDAAPLTSEAPLSAEAPPIAAGSEAAAAPSGPSPTPPAAADPAMPLAAPTQPAEVPELTQPAAPTLGAQAPPVAEPEGTSDEGDAVQRIPSADLTLPPVQRTASSDSPVQRAVASGSTPPPVQRTGSPDAVQRAIAPGSQADTTPMPVASPAAPVQRSAEQTGSPMEGLAETLAEAGPEGGSGTPAEGATEMPVQRAADSDAPLLNAPLQRALADESHRHDDEPGVQRVAADAPGAVAHGDHFHLPLPGRETAPVQRSETTAAPAQFGGTSAAPPSGTTPARFSETRPVQRSATAGSPRRLGLGEPIDPAAVQRFDDGGVALPFVQRLDEPAAVHGTESAHGSDGGFDDFRPVPAEAPALPIDVPTGSEPSAGPDRPAMPLPSASTPPSVQRLGLGGPLDEGSPLLASGPMVPMFSVPGVPAPSAGGATAPAASSVQRSAEPDLPVAVSHGGPMAGPGSNGPAVPVPMPAAPTASVSAAPVLPVVSRLVGDRPLRPALSGLPTAQPTATGASIAPGPSPADLPAVPVAQLLAEPPAGAPMRAAVPLPTYSTSGAGPAGVQRSATTATAAAAASPMRLATARPAESMTSMSSASLYADPNYFDAPPITVSRQVTVSASAENPVPTVSRASDGAATPAPATEATAAPGAPAGAAGAAGAVGAATQPDELVKKLFDPLLRRLKAELRLDRERRGSLTDLRH